MASPNGYILSETLDRIDRSWARGTLNYDASQAPWGTNLGGYRFRFEITTAGPAGPFNPAPLTSPGTQCNTISGNEVGLGGLTSTTVGVGGAGGVNPPQADTDYWVRVSVIDPDGVQVDQEVVGPYHTAPYPNVVCLAPTDVTQTSATVNLASDNGGRFNITPTCNQDGITWDISTSPTGPWTASNRELATDFTPSHEFAGLSPNTTYYYRVHYDEAAGIGNGPGEYLVSEPCSFTTLGAPVTTPSFNPQPCCDGSGGGDSCPEPVTFHRTTTSTGPVEHPGRQYDITLPINPGFAVQSMQVDSVTNAANIVWDVADPDGEKFRQDLTTFMEGRLPAPAVVTITNPNAGTPQVCGAAQPFQIHIECLRLDQNPPNLVELIFNGGQDLIQNPAYNENPPLNPPVAQGNYGYHLLARQDDPGPFPGNPPSGRVLCTSTANRGWETNDSGRTFEIWGKDVAGGVTPTPRGTPVQEITSDGPGHPGFPSTIWQTFQAPASGDFIIKVAHGARDAGEVHKITLDNGDTDDQQNGSLINDVTTPPSVYGNPWTQFNQTIPLTSGQTYTLALSSTNPVGGARGGLFTDMRAYIDRPNLRATATTDDDTCVVTVDETTTNCAEELWHPVCAGGEIISWTNVQTGVNLTNAAFWGQAPAPVPGTCPTAAAGGEGGSVAANLTYTYTVCAVVGGIPTNLQRVVVTDASGGTLADTFIGPDGGPVAAPSSYQIGSCTDVAFINDIVLCDVTPFGTISFLRKYIQYIDATGQGQVRSHRDFELSGESSYTVQGVVVDCTEAIADRETVCWTDSNSTPGIHTGTIRHVDSINSQGWLLFDQNRNLVTDTSGVTFVPCEPDPFGTSGLCLGDGTPIAVVTRWNHTTATYVDDGWINLLTGAFSAGAPPAGTRSCSAPLEIQNSGVLCDVTTSTNTVNALVIIQYNYNPDGSIASTVVLDATTGAPYTPVGQITVCPTDTGTPDNDMQVLCDRQADGSLTPFVRDYRRNAVGTINGFTDYTLAGAAYTVTGTVQSCIPRDSESVVLCDSATPTPNRFVRTYTYAGNGTISGFNDTTLAGAVFTPTGAVQVCPTATTDSESVVLCDTNSAGNITNRFLRTYTYGTTGAVAGFTDTTLTGGAYTPFAGGSIGVCAEFPDSETLVLCDSATPNPNRFLRTFVYSHTGQIAATYDTNFTGTPFAPTGAVGVCTTAIQSDTDFVEEILCDANGTSFIRLFRFNSATGTLISTTNTTLAGAAFTPVGTVGLCSSCCPSVVAEGCTNTGSGRYVAIRAANGTVSLFDAITGATVAQANIITCSAQTVTPSSVTLNSQMRGLAAGQSWTPVGDVTGTLTSVTLTVTGSGATATVTDSDGTVTSGLPQGYSATWLAEDHSTLTGPQSIAAVGGTVVINWTQK